MRPESQRTGVSGGNGRDGAIGVSSDDGKGQLYCTGQTCHPSCDQGIVKRIGEPDHVGHEGIETGRKVLDRGDKVCHPI